MAQPKCLAMIVNEGDHVLDRRSSSAAAKYAAALRNPAVTVAALSAAAAKRTATRVAGRDILAIQDTSEIVLGGPKVRQAGFAQLVVAAFWVGSCSIPCLRLMP